MKAYAQKNLMRLSLDVVLTDGEALGLPVGDIVFTTEHEPGYMVDPTLSLPLDFGQPLFDALWQAGYRPSVTTDDDATIDALKNHIEYAERMTDKLMTPVIIAPPGE